MRIPTLLLLIAGVVGAVDYELMDPKRDFCVHAWHQSAVLDNALYIVGGFVVYDYNNTRYEEPNTYLRTLNLTAPFTLNNAATAPFTFTPNPPDVPEISSGTLWPSKSTLYLTGGVTEPVDTKFPNFTAAIPGNTNALWTFQPSGGIWRNPRPLLHYPSGTTIPSSAGSNAAYVELADGTSTGYLLGGNQDPWHNVGYPGMLSYDFSAQSWQNISTPFAQWSSGALIHVPIGQAGILISLGGTRNNNMFTFDQVDIFNLETGSWSAQQPATAAAATGVPSPRHAFCAVLVSAPDRRSFQIFVYGGTYSGQSTGEPPQLEDVWVLSVPSFEWFNVYNGTADAAAPGKREAHSCHAVAGRQMLVYGGRSKPQQNQTCDSTGVFAFDMVDLAWQTEFKPAAGAYQVPGVVAKHLANNSSRFPAEGLADPQIQRMFEDLTPKNNSNTNTNTNTDAAAINNSPKTSNRTKAQTAGYIAAGVIAGLVISGCAAFFILRRRTVPPKSIDSSSSAIEIPDTQSSMYYTAEMPHHSPPAWELSAAP